MRSFHRENHFAVLGKQIQVAMFCNINDTFYLQSLSLANDCTNNSEIHTQHREKLKHDNIEQYL